MVKTRLFKASDSSIPLDEHLATFRVKKKQEEQAAFTPYWKFPIFNDDDDEYTVQYKEYLENSSNAITPDLSTEEPDNSLKEVKDDILHEKFLNIYLLIAKIESLNDNPTPDCVLKSPSLFPTPVEDNDSFFKKSDTSLSYSDNSLPKFETFSDHTEETSSGSTTTHADNSLPEYDSFIFKTEPDQDELTSVVMEDILGEPRVPNVFPTHPTLYLDSDFAPSEDYLKPNLVVSFPSGTRNKIFDPGIFYESLLPFSYENEDQIFNLGILSSNLLSHLGKITSDFSESPMMISGGDIPILDVPFLHFYPP
ncbi:hypothetical protein Tco_0519417 [Tanacetum coccineum]